MRGGSHTTGDFKTCAPGLFFFFKQKTAYEIVELRFSEGSRLRCTPGHRIWTVNRGWVHASELTEQDRVVRSFQYAPRPMASPYLPAEALAMAVYERSRKPPDLPEKGEVDFAHYLGWLTGDGCGATRDATAVTVYGT